MEIKKLIQSALSARTNAYIPYSGFQVGAALLTADGQIYTGCNIENAAYSPSCCAERTAFYKAVSEGKRHFAAIAIAGGPAGKPVLDYCMPCGVCLQVMLEFCDPQTFRIICARNEDDWREYLLADLFPHGFSLSGRDLNPQKQIQ